MMCLQSIRTTLLVALVILLGFAPVFAETIHVPGDYAQIQQAIDASVDGDTVLVQPGTYTEYGIDFRGKAITVTGTKPNDRRIVSRTVVDGKSRGSVFVLKTGEGEDSVIAGLTITGGYATNGGGLFLSASPTLSYCRITRNYGQVGGGVFVTFFGGVRMANCTVAENTALSAAGLFLGGDAHLTNCTIVDNVASYEGGGMQVADSSMEYHLFNTIVARNTSGWRRGGGLQIFGALILQLVNCTIVENNGPGLDFYVGGFHNAGMINTIVWGNDGGSLVNTPAGVLVNFSDIEGGWPEGEDNIDADPLFESRKGFDYLLGVGSPCIDAGWVGIFDGIFEYHPRWPDWYPNGGQSDMGAYGGDGNILWLPESGG